MTRSGVLQTLHQLWHELGNMRALVCKQYGAFCDLEDMELPSPLMLPGSVRIAVSFASVSFGIGMSIAGTHQKKHAPPFIPGNEVGGIVVEAADDIDGAIIGRRVVARVSSGAYAQEVIAPRETVYVLPDGVDLKAATVLPLSYGTAFSGLFWQAKIRPGESVLIHGAAGSLGLAAVQIARAAGTHVLATATTSQKREFVQSQGAREVFASDRFCESVKAATGGRGADIVFDPIGGSVFAESLKAVRPLGRIVIAGFASGMVPQIPANVLLVKNIRVLGHYYGIFVGDGATDESRKYKTDVQSLMETLLNWMQRGQIAPVISSVVPFAQYATAMDSINARTSIGKVLLAIAPAQ